MQNGFDVVTPSRVYQLMAESESDQTYWMQVKNRLFHFSYFPFVNQLTSSLGIERVAESLANDGSDGGSSVLGQ